MNEPWRGDALARTMAKSVSIPGDGEYHLVMSLPLNKHATRSNWFYTAQLTFQQGTEGTFGAHFQVRVRDAQGRSIMRRRPQDQQARRRRIAGQRHVHGERLAFGAAQIG